MRKECDGCPCVELKPGGRFCFYYQSWVNENQGCGNDFDRKPDKTQEEMHKEAFGESSTILVRCPCNKVLGEFEPFQDHGGVNMRCQHCGGIVHIPNGLLCEAALGEVDEPVEVCYAREGSFPWCEACQSYHDPINTTCKAIEVIEHGSCGDYVYDLKRRSDGSVFLEYDCDGIFGEAETPSDLPNHIQEIYGLNFFGAIDTEEFDKWWRTK